MARQGHAYATAQEVRVVYQDDSDDLTDVPADGKTVGEIVTRGNIVMKEVFTSIFCTTFRIERQILIHSISGTRKQQRRRLEGATSARVILR